MSRLISLLTALLTATLMAGEKPNLVLIFIDDMGYGDIGPFGSNLNRTPNLDRMAAEGMKLTSFYAAPVCSASRAQLMTGSYAPRVSVPGVFFPAGKNGLNPKEHTVADYLRESGYATMCVGKWHLGDQREFLPTNNGFDGYYGIPYSNDMGRNSSVDGRKVHPLMRNTEPEELLEDEGQRRITRLYTEEALRFITTCQKKKKPFFLYMPHTAMHVPLFPHQDFAGKSNNGTYGDWVEEVDWSVGQVLAELKRLGLDQDTLVVFTSDNGPWASKGKAGGVTGPLRGSKGCTLEGGVREPTIVRWPGKIPSGTSNDSIMGTTDILPTFVSLAGGQLKNDIKIDGFDISPVLMGQAQKSPREAWYYFQGNRLKAVRSGPWKLALQGQSLGMGMKNKPADLSKKMRLYNLNQEIGEMTDLAAANPEIVARLQKLGEAMEADIAQNKRPAGMVEYPVTLYPTASRRHKKQPKNTKPISWESVKIGDHFDPTRSPQIAGKPFEIACTIDGQKPVGVIVAHGGSSIGYALYTTADRKLVFAVRHQTDSVIRIGHSLSADGKVTINAQLQKDGTMSLSINNRRAVTKKARGVLKKQPQENLCIGHDDKNLLDEKAPKQQFNGGIHSLKISVH